VFIVKAAPIMRSVGRGSVKPRLFAVYSCETLLRDDKVVSIGLTRAFWDSISTASRPY
jgi:hypothetical protein